jgi:UDP-glucose 4-epimerase
MTIAVIGANSFIASALRQNFATQDWLFIGHAQASADGQWLRGISTVLNCAFDDRLKTNAYDERFDFDLHLARLVCDLPVHYIMLSSRLVYGASGIDGRLGEEMSCHPVQLYGQAKVITEQKLFEQLGTSLTVLRLSNIFGSENIQGRRNFVATALRTLIEQNKITLDISPFVEKDFLPVAHLVSSLITIAKNPKAGIFNIGAGYATKVGQIANWLVSGFGKGEVTVTNMRIHDAFWLDITAAEKAYGLEPINREAIEAFCIQIGQDLRLAQNRLALCA